MANASSVQQNIVSSYSGLGQWMPQLDTVAAAASRYPLKQRADQQTFVNMHTDARNQWLRLTQINFGCRMHISTLVLTYVTKARPMICQNHVASRKR